MGINSSLIAHVSVLHAVGTPNGYVEGFDEKSFSFWVEIFFFYRKMGLYPLSSNL